MSSLEKMSIQGIRSFGQEDRHRGVVQFFSPLTLILGPNGTGKTTIIECLKYITTGTFPPGVGRSGGSFVHDPKIAHETEVKAQVRLQFRDVRGKVTVVQRSMLATQKGKKVEFKTLDGVIRYKMTNGETREINSKCAELDREMVSLLGVSQPVLEHVIFCHQEDSNWPLGEGKALKTKFDDIFASTRYVKALEAIRKFRMNQQVEIRELSTEVKYLKQNKEKVQQLRTDLEDAEDRFLEARTAIEKITEKQLPIEAQLNKIRSNNDNINRLYGEKEALAEKKREIERNQAEIQRNITEEFDGSKDELQQAIDDFERQEYEQKKKLDKIERQMTELDNELRRLTTEQTKLTNEQGRLEHEAESYKQWLVSRNNLVKRIAQDYQLQGYGGTLSEAVVSSFLGKLETVINDKLRESKQKREEYEEKESGKQREVDEKRREHTRLETQLRMKAEQYKRNRAEVLQINQELSQVEASQDRLQDLANILHCKETELKDLEKEVDLGQLRSEVKKLEEEKNECTAKLRTLNSEVSRMSQESAARAQLEVSRKDKTQKADQIRRLKSKHEDTLSHLLGYVPESNMRRAVEAYVSQQSRLVRNGSDELRELRHNLTQMETERNMMKDRLAEKEQELKQLEEKMFNVSESDNFDEGLKRITEKLQQNVNEKGYLKGIVHLYNKFVSTLKKEDPGCPLCHRPFDQPSEVTELIEELEEKLNIVPDKLDKCSQVISTYKSKEERMLQMKPHKARIVDLKETEIPELNLKIRSHSGKIDSLKAKVGEKEEELDMQQMDEATAKSIQPDMVFVDKYQTEVQNLELQISHQASLISGSESSRTMQDVQSELQDAQLHLDSVSQTLSNRHQKINDHNNKLQRLGAHINELGREQVELKQNLQKRTQLEESRKELEVSNLNLQQEIQMAKTDIRPIQDEVERLVQEKETITNQGKVAWDQYSSQITKMKDSQKEVNGYQRQIHNYIAERKEEQLAESIEASCRLRQQCKRTEEKREDFSTTASSIKEDIAAQKSRERELQDNMLLILKQEQVDKIISKITELENKLGGIDVAHLQTELANKEDELRRLAHEKQTLTLKKEGKEGEIRLLKKSLKEDTYRTAEQDYTTKIVKLKTTEIANKDLEKYYKALDMTIMHYHKKKMAEINKIIRELWRNTYRGNDIETIEICSDEEVESGAAKKRRSYNYRVVMIKGDAALDMRGRCSAGQKVLASLIIRLALAETFCLHCGFFALDEPTTNLDRENIESLAYALVEIIKTRALQRNFQLLVITHDEDFVELLGRSDYVDEFFKVSKDDGGFSRLSKAKVEDIHR